MKFKISKFYFGILTYKVFYQKLDTAVYRINNFLNYFYISGEDCLALKYGSLANVLKASFLSSLEEANNLCEINENLTVFSEILKTTGFDEFYSMPQKVCNCFSIVSFI